MTDSGPSLTALERELLSYVERLTEASEQSAIQFRELEEKSSAMINERQNDLEGSLKLLVESQASLVTGLIAFASTLDPSANLPAEWTDSQESIRQALSQKKREALPA